jgi:hypothetical protein
MPASDQSVIVNYKLGAPVCYLLTLQVSGTGMPPTASPTSSTGCASGLYLAGELVALTAHPASGWIVGSWSGTNDDNSTSLTNSLTMPASSRTVTITYVQQCYSLTVSHTGNGSNPLASPVNSTGCSVGLYHAGEQIQLSGAAPSSGWLISGWTGTTNDAGKTSTNIVSMPADNHSASVKYAQIISVNLLSISAQDGWVLEKDELSGIGSSLDAMSTTFRLGDDKFKKQYRGILSFDSSSIPDTAIIRFVTLKIRQQAVAGGATLGAFQGLLIDLRKGTFGTFALQVTDFQAKASSPATGLGPFTAPAVSGWYSFNLTTSRAYINKLSTGSGLTQFRLRFVLDDNNDGVANYISFFSGNAGAASRPQLIVEYYVP